MKKKIAVLVMTVLVFGGANAQLPQPLLGFKLGVNLASQSVHTYGGKSKSGIKPGLAIGAFAELPVSKKISVQQELLFSILSGSEQNGNEKFATKFTYFSMPVLAKLNFKNGSIYAGPQLGFLLSAKAKYKYNGGSENVDIKQGFEHVDFSGVFGTELKLGGTLSLNTCYQTGFINLCRDKNIYTGYRNNNVQVSLAYRFGNTKEKPAPKK